MTRAEKRPITKAENIAIPSQFVRFATPEEVANYRAEKLACERILEIGSGIGSQTIAFSKLSKQVLAIEKNKERAEILKKNLEEMKIKNVTLIIGDALEPRTIEKVKEFKPEKIFCDTERKESGERTLEEIKPNVKEILKKYSPITKEIAIEIPPFTKDTRDLSENFEEEFISLHGKLNRLTLYFNTLKKSEESVVELPSRKRIEKKENKKIIEIDSAKGFEYLYEINPAVVLANMISDITNEEIKIINFDKKKYLLSNKKIESPFLKKYKIKKVCSTEEEAKKEIKKQEAGEVVLRISIAPEDYWKKRNFYENGLKGNKKINLFGNQTELIIAEDF